MGYVTVVNAELVQSDSALSSGQSHPFDGSRDSIRPVWSVDTGPATWKSAPLIATRPHEPLWKFAPGFFAVLFASCVFAPILPYASLIVMFDLTIMPYTAHGLIVEHIVLHTTLPADLEASPRMRLPLPLPCDKGYAARIGFPCRRIVRFLYGILWFRMVFRLRGPLWRENIFRPLAGAILSNIFFILPYSRRSWPHAS